MEGNYDPATYEADPSQVLDDLRRIEDWRRKELAAILNSDPVQ